MYIKILVYIIDNQQIKLKISIPFSVSWSFAVPVLWLRELGGVGPKNGRPAGPISGRWSVPHQKHLLTKHTPASKNTLALNILSSPNTVHRQKTLPHQTYLKCQTPFQTPSYINQPHKTYIHVPRQLYR